MANLLAWFGSWSRHFSEGTGAGLAVMHDYSLFFRNSLLGLLVFMNKGS